MRPPLRIISYVAAKAVNATQVIRVAIYHDTMT